MSVSTAALRYSIMNDFVDSFNVNDYYVFGSNVNSNITSINTNKDAREFLEKTIFGKKVSQIDVKFMIARNIWQPNTVYTQYDDSSDFTEGQFYVITEPETEAGDFRVFKCISNNYGSASVDKPSYSISLASQNFILQTSDGYKWKYMFSVTSTNERFYGSSNLFPVIADSSVISDARLGIDNIIVENPTQNFGYESVAGSVHSVRATEESAGGRFISLTSTEFNQISGYYSGYTVLIISSDGITTRKYTIIDSGISSNDQRPFIIVTGYNAGDITDPSISSWNFSITPAVAIIGNGTGASAVSVVNNGRITSIRMLQTGTNYTRAIARITPPNFGFNTNTGDVVCKLKVMLSPPSIYDEPGGHGGNPEYELNSKHVLVTTRFETADSIVIPDTNTYSKVGLVRDPVFSSNTAPDLFDARVQVEVTSTSQLSVGEIVTQPSTNFRGIIHAIDSINSIIYITEFFGPYFDQSGTTSFYLSNIIPLSDSQPLTTQTGRVEIVEGSVVYPDYVFATGEVLYISDFSPIERSSTLSEQYKFIISF